MCIDRPARRNSLTPEMMVALGEALTAFDDDPEAWAAVLYGEGEHFTAGLDLPAFAPYLSGARASLPEPRIDGLQLK
ncbi:enoyl-CoA hydratase-related protein, partial [Acinetobacter baumannii]